MKPRSIRTVVSLGAATLALGLLVGGCGGGGGDSTGKIASVQSVPTTESTPTPAPTKSTPKAPSKTKTTKAPKGRRGRIADALNRLPASQRRDAAQKAALAVFKIYGFPSPELHVSSEGKNVSAVVAAASACTGTSRTESRIASRLRAAVPFVSSVRITVGGTGKSLSAYIAGHCRSQLPSGRGRVVLSLSGESLKTSRSFTVRSKRWTIEYVNHGTFLQVLPLKASDQTPAMRGVSALKAGSGSKALKGPGTFTLRIAGTGEWTVRVRDGA